MRREEDTPASSSSLCIIDSEEEVLARSKKKRNIKRTAPGLLLGAGNDIGVAAGVEHAFIASCLVRDDDEFSIRDSSFSFSPATRHQPSPFFSLRQSLLRLRLRLHAALAFGSWR
jgi:hypothetical protein